MITPGELRGIKGNWLDGPFFPYFFPDTPEGNKRLEYQVAFMSRMWRDAYIFLAVGLLFVVVGVPLISFGTIPLSYLIGAFASLLVFLAAVVLFANLRTS